MHGDSRVIGRARSLRERFPKNTAVVERGFNHAARAVDAVCGKKQYADALKAADEYAPLAAGRVAELKSRVYDRWASSLAAAGEWEAALGKYLEGLKADPKSPTLTNNVIVIIDEWAGKSMDKKDWAGAIAVYETGLKHFPNCGHLKNNRDYCKEQQKK